MLARLSPLPLATALKKSSVQTNCFKSWRRCNFSSGMKSNDDSTTKQTVPELPPLSQPLTNLPTPVYLSDVMENQDTRITVLPNGLRVASENHFGQFCTVGVLIDSGSRFEVAYPSGISHFLEKLAYNSTKHFKSKDDIMWTMEKYGGICDCIASRDIFIYASSLDKRGLDTVAKVLGDIVLRPQITDDELNEARQTVKFDLESLLTRPEQETLLTDMIHAAAFRDNSLGLPRICPESNIQKIDRKILFTYLKNHHTPERMVVAGVGIDHDELVGAVQKYFVDEKPIWDEDSGIVIGDQGSRLVDGSLAQYTGSYVVDECNVPVHAGSSGLPELSHFVVGLESCSYNDPDFVAMCVLNMMMGGGGSFSSGGPGKGMYTRLYTNVLNRYHWLYSATASNHPYADTGLFCIHASSTPRHVKEMVEAIVQEIVAMTGNITENELSRAKKQLQSMLLMNLESRPVVFEDIGRQVLANGSRKRPEFFINQIEKIMKDDVARVAHRLLKSPPSVAARGDIRNLPTLANIQAGLLDRQGRMPGMRSRLSSFH